MFVDVGHGVNTADFIEYTRRHAAATTSSFVLFVFPAKPNIHDLRVCF